MLPPVAPRLLGKALSSWTSGLLEYSSESFPLALEGRRWREMPLVGCAPGWCSCCWQGTRGIPAFFLHRVQPPVHE